MCAIKTITGEVWECIAGHLDAQDCFNVASTSKHFEEIFHSDLVWQASLNYMVELSGASTSQHRELCRQVKKALVTSTYSPYHRAKNSPQDADSTDPRLAPNVILCAEGCSSMDNDNEHPGNVLFESRCARYCDQVTPQTMDVMKRSCACWMGNPCYWSSAASTDSESAEWLLFRLTAPVCVITSASLSPYKAWWQPPGPDGCLPVYSPKEVEYEFGSFHGDVSTPLGLNIPISSLQNGARRKRGEVMHSTSGSIKVPRIHNALVTTFRKPLLVLGGHVRVRLHGKTQRQTIWHSNDHYTCVQNINFTGAAVRGAVCCHDGGTGDWVVVQGRSCNVCGSHVKGDGDFEAMRLLACATCERSFYCCASHRGDDHWHKHVECPQLKSTIPDDFRQ